MKNFKFHWGWRILLVYLLFMSVFIFYFIRSFKELETNEMVTNDYYNKELNYEKVIDKKKNADTMRMAVQILQTPKGLKIQFPTYVSDVHGQIELYKPDNSKLDKAVDIKLAKDNSQLIPSKEMVPGRWNVSVDWQSGKVPYRVEKKIMLK